jgi:hypothetical protein
VREKTTVKTAKFIVNKYLTQHYRDRIQNYHYDGAYSIKASDGFQTAYYKISKLFEYFK